MITFTKHLVKKINNEESNQYITKCLKFIIKKYNKIISQSFPTTKQSKFWKDMTKTNIGRCFSQAKDMVRLGSYIIEVSRNGEQLAVACLDINTAANFYNIFNIPHDIKLNDQGNSGFIFNLCVPSRYRKQGYCKKLMNEIHYLLTFTNKKRSRRSRIRKQSLCRKNPFIPKVSHITKRVNAFYLEVYDANVGALKCYEYIKFKKLGEYEKHGKKVFLFELK